MKNKQKIIVAILLVIVVGLVLWGLYSSGKEDEIAMVEKSDSANMLLEKEAAVYTGLQAVKRNKWFDGVENRSFFPLHFYVVAGCADGRNQAVSGFSFVLTADALPIVQINFKKLFL